MLSSRGSRWMTFVAPILALSSPLWASEVCCMLRDARGGQVMARIEPEQCKMDEGTQVRKELCDESHAKREPGSVRAGAVADEDGPIEVKPRNVGERTGIPSNPSSKR
jgi:hypothetical protein